jgi:hypothetical protein
VIDRCGADAEAWVARCALASHVPMRLDACPPAVAIVELSPAGSSRLRVEISTSPNAFRRAGAHGFSPVGSFDDWAKEPEALRNAFDALVSCAEREPPDALIAQTSGPPASAAPQLPHPSFPLVPLAAVVAIVFALRRVTLRALGWGVLAVIATFVLRRFLQPVSFFHQNGQGPEWIQFALQGDAGAYGPGYPELFGWIVSRARRPDLALFEAQQLLAATVVVSAYALVRVLTRHRIAAIAAGVFLAVDPVLMRTARSESYFAAIIALLFASMALVACTDRTRARVPGLIAAALLAAIAARIHPVGWLPCAFVPLPLFLRGGRISRRTWISVAIVGSIVLCLTFATIRAALRTSLGDSLAQVRATAVRIPPWALGMLVITAIAAWLRPRWGLRFFGLTLVVSAVFATNILRGNIPVVAASYVHLFAPALLACVVTVVPPPILAVAIAALAGFHTFRERPLVAPTTDNAELTWALEWRESLPSGSTVVALQRTGKYTLVLPVSRVVTLRDGAGQFYYRGSLCAVEAGAAECAAFEATHRLRLVTSRRFPSRPSAWWLPLPPGDIEVALFAIEGQR